MIEAKILEISLNDNQSYGLDWARLFDRSSGSGSLADIKLEVTAERRQPQVTARHLLTARIEPGVARYEATFFYNVRYSGVKSLRIFVSMSSSGMSQPARAKGPMISSSQSI